jgi:hypothetical protein
MPAAAFDTRVDLPVALTGRASKGIARKLRRHGATLISRPESFLVTKDNHFDGIALHGIAPHPTAPG